MIFWSCVGAGLLALFGFTTWFERRRRGVPLHNTPPDFQAEVNEGVDAMTFTRHSGGGFIGGS